LPPAPGFSIPAGAYVTLEHEYILIFRKGARRSFATPAESENRRRSALFWEERNLWFSDLWDFKGARQSLDRSALRARSAAFPFELAYRLVNMYSVRNDRVLDPFLGTGTTMFAAMAAGRDSIGVELEPGFAEVIEGQLARLPQLANERIAERLEGHAVFMAAYEARKGASPHRNRNYGFPVVTSQETDLVLDRIRDITRESDGRYRVSYDRLELPG